MASPPPTRPSPVAATSSKAAAEDAHKHTRSAPPSGPSSNNAVQAAVSIAIPSAAGSLLARASLQVKTPRSVVKADISAHPGLTPRRLKIQLAAGGKGSKGIDKRLPQTPPRTPPSGHHTPALSRQSRTGSSNAGNRQRVPTTTKSGPPSPVPQAKASFRDEILGEMPTRETEIQPHPGLTLDLSGYVKAILENEIANLPQVVRQEPHLPARYLDEEALRRHNESA